MNTVWNLEKGESVGWSWNLVYTLKNEENLNEGNANTLDKGIFPKGS